MQHMQQYLYLNFMNTNHLISSFKANLVKFRRQMGLSQRGLAKKMGVSQRVVSYYEKDAADVPLSRIIDLANALNVTVIELLDPKMERRSNWADLDVRIIRKIRQIEKLPRRKQDELWQHINTALEIQTLKAEKKDTASADTKKQTS
jgi:transcriptional regulator with XRE-family HTH domain